MRASIAALGLGLVTLAFGSSCDWQAQSDCHRDLVERLGCCPTCESECREAIGEACAEIHDTPLQDAQEPGGSSEGGSDAEGEPSPEPR